MSSSGNNMEVDPKTIQTIKKEVEEELHLNVLASQNVYIKEENQNAEVKNDNNMDIDAKDLPIANEKTVFDAVRVQITETKKGLTQLSVDGIAESVDDEMMHLTPEEVRAYLEQKIREHLMDPEINPFLELTKRSQELQAELKEKNEEFNKLNKLFEMIYRNQEKFLRHMGILAKIPTKSVAVSVDLPMLPGCVPGAAANNLESVLKKNVVVQNTAPAPVKRSTPATVTVNSVTKIAPKPPEMAKKFSTDPPKSSIECIDLTDEVDPSPPSTASKSVTINVSKVPTMLKHPAPLPPRPYAALSKALPGLPPKPRLKVHAEERGIVLQWDMPTSFSPNSTYSKLSAYDIFGYQEQSNVPINTLLWKKIGSVKAMTLPMACTLTQFLEGNKYHFSIRAMDIHNRYGSYSDPISIVYTTRPRK